MATLDPGLAVSVEQVTQRFSLRHEKTLKGLLLSRLDRRHPTTDSFIALDDVTLEIPIGRTMGLIGHNGSGKSTLLKIIGGVLTPTSGQVRRRGSLAALLELGAGFNGELSGRENVLLNAQLLGMSRAEIERKFDDIVQFSGVERFIDTPMKFYSTGMFVRLGFAVAIHMDPDVLLVDEVLAVGDEQFQAKCLEVIRRYQQDGRTIVLVTHNMKQVQEFCDDVALLHHGVLRARGAPADAIATFRSLQSEEEQARRRSPGTDEHPETGRAVRVDKAVVSCSSGPIERFQQGDSIFVVVTYRAEEPADRWVGRVFLKERGHVLHGTSTLRLHAGPPSLDGVYTVEFTLPSVRLAGGSYRLWVDVAPGHGEPAWDVIPAADLVIPTEERRIGPLPIDPRASGYVP